MVKNVFFKLILIWKMQEKVYFKSGNELIFIIQEMDKNNLIS